MSDAWLWLGLFILVAYTLEAITGFGSTIVALSLGAPLLPIQDLLPVLARLAPPRGLSVTMVHLPQAAVSRP